ncbi:MAG: undecaprenyl-phosphate galactose phosphotransferase WbaP [Verrucomicrobia bacterium]|nr:undecaprenyl-phosphate galactose phosphotransferase WbaP [Verrucomicrobiota bacterium]
METELLEQKTDEQTSHYHSQEARTKDVLDYLRRRMTNILALGLSDAAAVGLSLFIAGGIRWLVRGDLMLPEWGGLMIVLWWIGALGTRLLPGWGLGASEELRRQILLLTGVFGVAIAALFLSKASTTASRFTMTFGYAIGLVLVPLMRAGVKRRCIAAGIWGVPSVVYGSDLAVKLVIQALRHEAGLGYKPTGVFDDESPKGSTIEKLPVLGGIGDRTNAAHVAIVAMPSISRHQLIEILDGPLSGYRTVLIIPDLFEAPSLWVQPRDIRGILGLEITVNLLDPLAKMLKRATELSMVIAAAPLWMPLCLITAALVWIEDRSNPIYVQKRVGHQGRIFSALKFRTMHRDAERILEKRIENDPELREEWEKDFKLKDDPRITKIGAFLRKTSLDELPQFINVLKGDMALVGPRPLPAYHHNMLPERVRELRERVKPGITGLWQVSGRSEVGTTGMERWDSYYVRNWSIWLDFVIIVRTFRAVCRGEGAY